MPSVGGYSVSTWQGNLHRSTRKGAVLESAAGVNGVAVVVGGWTNGIDQIRTIVEVASKSLAEALIEYYLSLSGTTQTCIDQHGTAWPSVTIVTVMCDREPNNWNGKWRVVANWAMIPATEAPRV